MVILFRSLLVPVVILCALPLAVVGAFVALALTGCALDLSALPGLLMLRAPPEQARAGPEHDTGPGPYETALRSGASWLPSMSTRATPTGRACSRPAGSGHLPVGRAQREDQRGVGGEGLDHLSDLDVLVDHVRLGFVSGAKADRGNAGGHEVAPIAGKAPDAGPEGSAEHVFQRLPRG
jgi:hypothetical protein